MKQKTLLIFFAIGILFSCNKINQPVELNPPAEKQDQTLNRAAKIGGSLTILSPNIQGVLKTMNFGSPTAYWPPAAGGFVNNFSFTTDCNNNTVLNLNEVVLYGSGFPNQIKINGNLFTLNFDYSIQPCVNVFKLLNISGMEIGADLNSSSTVLTFSYHFCLDPYTCEGNTGGTWENGNSYLLGDYACTNGSAQPSASSPGANQLRLYVPIPFCVSNIFKSESYQFRYRIAGTLSWTETAVYPQSIYIPGVTISGVPAGTYEFQGRNICPGSTGPWVPGVGSNVVVN